MKAEKDDMPEYLRNRKKPGPWRFVAIMGVGSAIFWAAAMMFAKPIAVDIDQIKNGIHVAGTPWFNQEPKKPAQPIEQYQPPQPARSEPVPAKAAALREVVKPETEWFEHATKEAEARRQEPRQTSFNDQNYQRRGAINRMPPQPMLDDSASKPNTTRTKKEIVVVGKEDRPEDWICSYIGKEGSIKRRECKMRYQLNNRN